MYIMAREDMVRHKNDNITNATPVEILSRAKPGAAAALPRAPRPARGAGRGARARAW